MKFLAGFMVTLVAAYVLALFLPWWSVALAAGLAGTLIGNKTWLGFLYGFFGVFLIWLLQTYMMDTANESLLSNQMGQLFSLGGGMTMILVSSLLGGLVGGFGGATGASLHTLIFGEENKRGRKRRRRRR